MSEIEFSYRTRGGSSIENKPKVYFTCHPDDFDKYFESVCKDILALQDCAIFYTEDMNADLSDKNTLVDLERMSLFVFPVTFKLLTTYNRAMRFDFRFAQEKHIPVLPLLMESEIYEFYKRPENFGELQYIKPSNTDITAIDYKEKLKKYLESVLVSDELAQRIREAFDAYVFLSYRKKDRKYANELMKLIHKKPKCEDIAIWFDEFLTPGESFRENIEKILKDSELFTLLVTPSLLERQEDGTPNFIIREEYPKAKDMGKPILPAEMEHTDKEALERDYKDIPECTNTSDEEEFYKRLLNSLMGIALHENDDKPEHNYLIGLAYLKGIDVEIDIGRGIRLLTKAAEGDLPESMTQLFNMCMDGDCVQINYDQALYWIKKLYDYNVRNYGEENEDTIWSLDSLASTYGEIGDYENAIETYDKCYELGCKVFGEESQDTISILNSRAIAYGRAGKVEECLEQSERCYELRSKILGSTHEQTLVSLSNLALSYGDSGNYLKMLELSEECYDLMGGSLGDEDPRTITAMDNLAVAYSKVYNFTTEIKFIQKCIELQDKAYQLSVKVNGYNNPTTLIILGNLASSLGDNKEYQKSIVLGEQCYKLRKEMFGESHPLTLLALTNLAHAYGIIKNKLKCLELSNKSYQLYRITLGDENPLTLIALNNLATAYGRVGKRIKRVKLCKQCYNIQKKVLGETNPNTLSTMYNLAGAYAGVGRFISSGWLHWKGVCLTMQQYARLREVVR